MRIVRVTAAKGTAFCPGTLTFEPFNIWTLSRFLAFSKCLFSFKTFGNFGFGLIRDQRTKTGWSWTVQDKFQTGQSPDLAGRWSLGLIMSELSFLKPTIASSNDSFRVWPFFIFSLISIWRLNSAIKHVVFREFWLQSSKSSCSLWLGVEMPKMDFWLGNSTSQILLCSCGMGLELQKKNL